MIWRTKNVCPKIGKNIIRQRNMETVRANVWSPTGKSFGWMSCERQTDGVCQTLPLEKNQNVNYKSEGKGANWRHDETSGGDRRGIQFWKKKLCITNKKSISVHSHCATVCAHTLVQKPNLCLHQRANKVKNESIELKKPANKQGKKTN